LPLNQWLPHSIAYLHRIHALQDYRDSTDTLVDSKKLGHDGPSTVQVTDSVCEYFGVNALYEITQDHLDQARSETRKLTVQNVVIEAYAVDDNGAEGPEWAELKNPTGFLDRVIALQTVIREHRLSEARVHLAPDLWGPSGVSDELRPSGQELVVTGDSFWFTCHPKASKYHCETRAQDIEHFRATLAGGNTEVLLLGCDPVGLAQRREDLEEDATVEHCELSPSM